MRVGEFTANTKYARKRVDFNIFDDIGHGHKIHATSFGMNPSMERQQSLDANNGSVNDLDLDSNDGSVSLIMSSGGRRRSSVATSTLKRPSYIPGSKGIDKRATASPMKFPAVPSAFPKAPTGASFPAVPESPPPAYMSRAPSETSQNQGLQAQVTTII